MKKQIKKTILLAVSIALSGAAFAIGESNYNQDYNNLVMPFYNYHGVGGSFTGVDNVNIAYRKFELAHETGAVVVVPGRSEPMKKYAELAYDLSNKGYSVYLMDVRGQGESGRMVSNSQIGYVHKHQDYVTDLDTFVNKVVKSKSHSKLFLIAHSMGGAIGAKYLIDHNSTFTAAVLNSPMLMINTAPYAEWVAKSIVDAAVTIGKGKKYAIGKKDYDFNAKFDPAKDDVTHSAVRWNMKTKIVVDNHSLAVGGPSNNWVKQGIEMTHNIRDNASKASTPVLVLEAGQDTIVKLDGEDHFCSKAKNCTKVKYDGARHEILQETDDIRNAAMAKIFAFLAAH